MADKKRKIEEIVFDLKTNGEKKLKAGDSPTSRKSKMAANKENSKDGAKNESMSGLGLNTESDMDAAGEQSLRSLMLGISKDINSSISGLNARIKHMEENFELNLIDKLSSVINVTVKEEIEKVRSDFDSEICAIRTKVVDMEEAVKDFSSSSGATSRVQQPCSVVIRGLKEGRNETVGINSVAKNKVISLVRDGLKLKEVRVTSAERKQSKGDNPGLIIANLETAEQLKSVLSVKRTLRQTNEYRSVYIEPYLSQAELSTQGTFRTLLREMGKSDSYHVHGSKLIPRRQDRERSQSDERKQTRDRSPWRSRNSGQSRGRNHRRERSTERGMSTGRSDNHGVNRGRSRSLDRSDSYAEITRRDDGMRDNRSNRIHDNGRGYDRNGSYDNQSDNRSRR